MTATVPLSPQGSRVDAGPQGSDARTAGSSAGHTAPAPPPVPPAALTHRAWVRRRFAIRRERRADVLAALAVTSVAAAVSLYLAYEGLRGLASIADAVTTVGIVAGLIGTDLVLVMLVLAARIPVVDRTFGRDVVLAQHQRLGKPALYLLLAHGALVIVGYAMRDGVNPIAETLSLLSMSDIVLAVLAMGLFVTVVVSSLVAVRRRFPYELWHGIHLLSYAAVLTALPHQLSVGGVFAEGTFQRAYWIALYAFAIGAIGWFRFLVPTFATLRHDLRVEGVERISSDVVSIHLRGRNLSRLGVVGGQYAMWRFWTGRTWWHAHPISFSSVGDDTRVRITVRVLGAGSGRLAKLPAGTRVSIEGPYGIFTGRNRTAPHLAVIAAGIGVTPVRALLEDADLVPGEATVLLRASTPEQRYLWSEVGDLVARSGGRIYGSVGPRPAGLDTWMSGDNISRGVSLGTVFPNLRSSDLFVCGPQAWADLVVRDALAAGVPAGQIHTERFDW
jgi:predicted ferric reductase